MKKNWHFLSASLWFCGTFAIAQEPKSDLERLRALSQYSIPESLVKRLPAEYQDAARRVSAPDNLQDLAANLTDDEWRGWVFAQLTQKSDGAEFLKSRLEKETSSLIRIQIFASLESYFAEHPQEQSILEKYAASDPDPNVALMALDSLRRITELRLREILEKRLADGRDHDQQVVHQLREAQLKRYEWYSGIRLPDFAFSPPSVFSVRSAEQSIRVLAFGDSGWGSGAQFKTAAAMRAYHKQHPFDFGITLGDNLYGRGPLSFAGRSGVATPDDARWQTLWEQLYGPMGIRFYPVFGNADYFDPDGPAAELAYTNKSASWVFAAPYYTFTAGAVQFFAIDTIRLTDEELRWLDRELGKSKARWKVVYGHYHIYSATPVGDNEELVTRLMPLLRKGSADIWFNGHQHDLQELQAEAGVHFFVSGAAGAPLTNGGAASSAYKRSRFRSDGQHGFSVIEADAKHIEVIFVDEDGRELHRSHITK